MDSTTRLLETAADELARLDTTCTLAPPAASVALGFAVASATPGEFGDLVSVHGDPAAAARIPPETLDWHRRLTEEERRARSGAALTCARLGIPADPALDLLLRDASPRRAALDRAIEIAARIEAPRLADAAAALVLVGAGRTDRLRLSPFAGVPPEERDEARRAFGAGDEEPWRRLALGALAARARTTRLAVGALAGSLVEERDRLALLGRGRLTAEDALAILRDAFACTMPSLAEQLGVSRPAAADALERLVATGIAREVTGRRRDRVYAYEAAFRIGVAALA